MPKYDFHLRSGNTVTIEVPNLPALIGEIIERAARPGGDDTREWISQPGMASAVRWSDIEGWQAHHDGIPPGATVTTDNPNLRP